MDEVGFARDGYTVLRNAIEKSEVERYLREAVRPAIQEVCGIDIFGNGSDFPKHRQGDAIRGRAGTLNEGHPISSSAEKRWPALFSSKVLLSALDRLHGGRENWEWDAGAVDGVGWIHIRWPFESGRWTPPSHGWHLDTGPTHLMGHQSVVCLPCLTPLRGNCGGTALLRGSHLAIARALRDSHGAVSYQNLADYINGYLMPALLRSDQNAIQEARAEPGDILVVHPLLFHASSNASLDAPVRITFNLSIRHSRKPFLSRQDPCLVESAILSALHSKAHPSEQFTSHIFLGGEAIRYGEPLFLRFLAHGGIIGLQPLGDIHQVGVFPPGLETARTDTPQCALAFRPFFDLTQEENEDRLRQQRHTDDDLTMMTFEDTIYTDRRDIGDIICGGDTVTLHAFYKNMCIQVEPPEQDGEWTFATASAEQSRYSRFELSGFASLPVRYGDVIALRASSAGSFLHADPSWTDGGRLGAQYNDPRGDWQQISILRFLRPDMST